MPRGIPPGSGYTPEEIREYILQSREDLGPRKTAALLRAFHLGDDQSLLTERPTNTSNPPRPRTVAAGYDYKSKTMFVRFRGERVAPGIYQDGVGYEYYGVTRREWNRFRAAGSPGRMINQVFNGKPYTRAAW
ncbi:KTSC domain-containing protein [Streptomyces sp. MMBL 11-1]|uniref:KTSC domain-containing protein n=1 Tax=Streptomyces sp. MMBL 11-1 TaxID=3026420 RepID=UPI002361DCA5|nr:KTSC domain-containing protein [Streptomyces sp. MMBL 11-1]